MTEKESKDVQEKISGEGRGILQTAVLLACSAAFGGLAVALWNRKTLNRMHSELEEGRYDRTGREAVLAGREDDIY
jgi:hypothetical protein